MRLLVLLLLLLLLAVSHATMMDAILDCPHK
jgi:hypothetical protein